MFDIKFETWLLIVFISILLFIIGVKPYFYWFMRGVPIDPVPFIGNFWSSFISATKDIGRDEITIIKTHYEKGRKYYGSYLGAEPELVIIDLDMVKKVLVNEFSSFTNKPSPFDAKPFNCTVLGSVDDHWKHSRSFISPAFSTVKLKRMIPIIETCCKCFVDILREKLDNPKGVLVNELTENWAIDIIGRSFLGLDTDCQRNPQSDFAIYCKKLVSLQNFFRPGLLLKLYFPFLTPVIKFLDLNSSIPKNVFDYIERLINQIYEDRKRSDSEISQDFLQSMVQAEVRGETTDRVAANGKQWNSTGLLRKEIIGNLMTMLFAGSSVVSKACTSAFYSMAINMDCQKTLYQEIVKEIGHDEDPSYEKIQKVKYLDMFLCETQRIYTQDVQITRKCSSDTVIEDIYIEKGVNIRIPLIYHLRNPDIFPDPLKFIPERFSPENKSNIPPCAFMPFGFGPRNCVGQRFAKIEVKLIIIYVLRNFEIRKTSDTPDININAYINNLNVGCPVPFHLAFIPRK